MSACYSYPMTRTSKAATIVKTARTERTWTRPDFSNSISKYPNNRFVQSCYGRCCKTGRRFLSSISRFGLAPLIVSSSLSKRRRSELYGPRLARTTGFLGIESVDVIHQIHDFYENKLTAGVLVLPPNCSHPKITSRPHFHKLSW